MRCEAVLGRAGRPSVEQVLALTVAAAVAWLVAMGTEVLTLQLGSSEARSTVLDAVRRTWLEGEEAVAIATLLTIVVAPACFIGLRLYVLTPLALGGRRVPGFAACVRLLRLAGEWNLLSVFTVGALLSLVRLSALADAVPGPALFALGALTLLFAAIESAGLKHLWWHVA
jgi:paraquat-inducible protein A